MAFLLLGIGVLLLFVLSFMNVQTGEVATAIAYGATGTALLVFTWIYLVAIKPANEKFSRDKILEWIKNNERQILSGGAEYDGIFVNRDTVLVKYCIVYSAVAFTRKTYSNYCFEGSGRSVRVGLISTLFNLVMGWWGIPWGLIYTPQALYLNLAQKLSITVEQAILQPQTLQQDIIR